MRENTKFNLKNIFGSPFSNTCAINAARTLPWWSGFICLLLGVLLPLIPLVVSVSRTSGSDAISGTNYGFDRDMTGATLEIYHKGGQFKVDNENLLHYYVNDVEQKPDATEDIVPIARYINTNENQYELDVYFSNREISGENKLSEIFDKHKAKRYKLGSVDIAAATEEDKNCYVPSIVIFHKNGLFTGIFKHKTLTATTSYNGDWVRTEKGTDLVKKMLTVEGMDIPATLNESTDPYKYVEGVHKNYKGLYDDCYLETKNRMYLLNTTVYFGVYLGLVLLLGLLLFFLTRSKKNPNNYLKWYHCQLIAYWASFAPGLLSMVLGFIIPNFAVMFFILFMGLRAMWISMKQLSPAYQQQ